MFRRTKKKLNFTKEYFELLAQEVEGIELVSLEELKIKTRFNGKEATHFLDNAYHEYKGDSQNKKEVLERYLKSAIDLYTPQPEYSLDQVVPIIKDQQYIEEVVRITDQETVPTLHEKYNSELYIFYARDLENTISYITLEDAEKFKIELEGLFEVAIENLMIRLGNIERHGENGYYMLTAGGDYEASLMLEPSIWTKDNFDVKGEIVIGIPARDLLLITGSEDEAGIEKLRNSILEIQNSGSYIISDKLFILNQGKFEVWG